MKVYEYPQIDNAASPEAQLAQIKAYLFKLVDELNANLNKQSAVSIFEQAASAFTSVPITQLEQQNRKDNLDLRRVVLMLAAGVLTCEGVYYTNDSAGGAKAANVVNICGNEYTVAGLIKMLVEKATGK